MLRGKRIWELALVGGLLWTCAANATTICELDVEAPITNTGVCAQVITTLGGIVVEDLDESTSEASASAQQGVDPPAAGSQGASGTAGGTFPDPDGTGGSVSAAAFVSGDGTLGEIMSAASSFFIGEFIADDGVDGSSDPFDLTVNLDITGELFVEGPAFAILTVGVAAVDSDGNPLVDGSDFPGGVAVLFPGGFIPLGFTDLTGFTQSGTCPDPCTVTVDATESIVLDGLVDRCRVGFGALGLGLQVGLDRGQARLDLGQLGREILVLLVLLDAEGAGQNAIWLAQRGLHVTVADIADRGLARARQLARQNDVVLHTVEVDLEEGPFPPGPWDLIVSFLFRKLLERKSLVQRSLRQLDQEPR